MAAPVVQIASIGTQISEAFAGLDRIREMLQMATEDDEDSTRGAARSRSTGEVEFEDVCFEYNPGRAGAEARVSSARRPAPRPRSSGRAGPGKSTLISLVMAFNRPLTGRICVDGRDLADGPPARLPRAARRRAAGQLPVRRHHRRQHPLRHARRDRGRDSRASAASRTPTSSSRSSRRSTTRSSASAASSCPAGSASASPSRARSWPTRAS